MRKLNIFTDASIITSNRGETIGCAGAICAENNNLCKFEVLRDCTNNIAEITAVELAIRLALENRELFDEVNIWADSQWSIYGLTKWNRSWVRNMINYIMFNSSSEAVKNQHLFLGIMKLIVDNNLKVNFYHIKGHVDEKNIKSINHAVSVFNRSNNATISRDKMYSAVIMNNMVDNHTRNILKSYKHAKRESFVRGIVQPILSNQDLIRYYSLVTLGGNKI